MALDVRLISLQVIQVHGAPWYGILATATVFLTTDART